MQWGKPKSVHRARPGAQQLVVRGGFIGDLLEKTGCTAVAGARAYVDNGDNANNGGNSVNNDDNNEANAEHMDNNDADNVATGGRDFVGYAIWIFAQ